MRSVLFLLPIMAIVSGQSLACAQAPLELILQTGHTDRVTSVALSSDGKYLVTGSHDQSAILWDATSGKKLQAFIGHTREVMSVAMSADGKQVVTGSRDRTAILWDAASGKKLRTFPVNT